MLNVSVHLVFKYCLETVSFTVGFHLSNVNTDFETTNEKSQTILLRKIGREITFGDIELKGQCVIQFQGGIIYQMY